MWISCPTEVLQSPCSGIFFLPQALPLLSLCLVCCSPDRHTAGLSSFFRSQLKSLFRTIHFLDDTLFLSITSFRFNSLCGTYSSLIFSLICFSLFIVSLFLSRICPPRERGVSHSSACPSSLKQGLAQSRRITLVVSLMNLPILSLGTFTCLYNERYLSCSLETRLKITCF